MGGNMKIFEGVPCRMLIGLFLILWGLTFLFSGIWGLSDLISSNYSIGFALLEVLWDLTDLALAGVLAILGFKVLLGQCFSAQIPPA